MERTLGWRHDHIFPGVYWESSPSKGRRPTQVRQQLIGNLQATNDHAIQPGRRAQATHGTAPRPNYSSTRNTVWAAKLLNGLHLSSISALLGTRLCKETQSSYLKRMCRSRFWITKCLQKVSCVCAVTTHHRKRCLKLETFVSGLRVQKRGMVKSMDDGKTFKESCWDLAVQFNHFWRQRDIVASKEVMGEKKASEDSDSRNQTRLIKPTTM